MFTKGFEKTAGIRKLVGDGIKAAKDFGKSFKAGFGESRELMKEIHKPVSTQVTNRLNKKILKSVPLKEKK